MKDYSELKFLSIGFGFLAGYLYPCYSRFCKPEEVCTHLAAVTADAATLEQKRGQYPFPIYLNENTRALETLHPDVILFSPPPSVAPELAEQVLKPYYDALRAAGQPLPDLYAFPPSPQAQFYLDLLGEDIHACNILPNMTRQIAGVDLHGAEGNTYVTLPKTGTWPMENLRLLESVFAPLGGVIYADPDNIRDILAAMCVAETLPLACFAISDALQIQSQTLASTMRAIYQDAWNYHPKGSTPCDRGVASPALSAALERFLRAWTQGGIDYMCQSGVDSLDAEKIMVSSMDLRLHIVQLEDRATVETTLKNHATKGGVAERGRLCYELLVEQTLREKFADCAALARDDAGEAFFRNVSFEIAQIVGVHGRRMAGQSVPTRFTPEHHAVLYALFVRNAGELAGAAGDAAIHSGTLLYADQRGARMAKRCLAHGDALDPFGYMAYGEWAPEPGTMEARDVAFTPDVVTEAYVCPWLTAWERKGFLKEGVAYCSCIDYHLVKGFNRDMELTVASTRTEGADCCRFVWKGFSLDEAGREALAKKKAALGDSCRKDWIYHTRHIYAALCETLSKLPQGEQIIEKTIRDFEILYGTDAKATVTDIAGIQFYDI